MKRFQCLTAWMGFLLLMLVVSTTYAQVGVLLTPTQQPEEYVNSVQSRINELDQGMDFLTTKAQRRGGDILDRFERSQQDYEQQRSDVLRNLQQLRTITSPEDYQNVQARVEQAMTTLAQTYRVAALNTRRFGPGEEGAPETREQVTETMPRTQVERAPDTQVERAPVERAPDTRVQEQATMPREYPQEIVSRLSNIDRGMNILEARAEHMGGEVQNEFRQSRQQIRQEMQTIQNRMENLRQANEADRQQIRQDIASALDEVEAEYGRLSVTIDSRMAQERQRYLQEAQTRLTDYRRGIDILGTRAEQPVRERRPALQTARQEFQQELQNAEQNLQELRGASPQQWEQRQNRLETAMRDLEAAYGRLALGFFVPQSFAARGEERLRAPQRLTRVRDLVGRTVNDWQGRRIGDIDTFVVGQDGRTNYAVISGDDGRMYPVPVTALLPGVQENTYALNVGRQRLQYAPSFERGAWPDLADPEWQQRVFGYYGVEQPTGPQVRRDQRTAMQKPARVSRLMDRPVRNLRGENLGSLWDVVVSENGRISYVLLSPEETLGMQNQLVPIPWRVVREGRQGVFLVNVDRERLRNAPSFARGNWPNFDDPQWQQTVFGYYGQEQPTGRAQPIGPGAQRGQQRTIMEKPARVSRLTDRTVVSPQGENLGTLGDVVIGEDGRISYVLLHPAEALGMQNQIVPIPWRAVREGQQNNLIVNLDRERLRNAPSFTRNNWPDFDDPQWRQNVLGYYGHQQPMSQQQPTNQ